MANSTLIILAAGLGSRFGGFKQLEEFTKIKKTILEFSIHDAIESGFDNVIIVTREELIEILKEKLIWIKGKIHVEFCIQFHKTSPNNKPLKGTAMALYSCAELIHGKCLVVNADDFYGKSIFKKAKRFMESSVSDQHVGIIPYPAFKTINSNHSVSRALCKFDGIRLRSLIEIKSVNTQNASKMNLNKDSLVSMNVWIFDESMILYLKEYWNDFISRYNSAQKEFQLPNFVEWLIKQKNVDVLEVGIGEEWCGVTYKNEIEFVNEKLNKLIDSKKYNLF